MHINVYTIFQKIHENGSLHDHRIGRLLILDNKVYVLEDHHKAMTSMFPVLNTQSVLSKLAKFKNSPSWDVKDFKQSNQIDLNSLNEYPNEQQSEPIDFNNVQWLYKLNGMEKYHTLSVKDSVFHIDHQPLDNKELAFIVDSLNNGQAVLKFPDGKVIKSIDDMAQSLRKDDQGHSPTNPQPNLNPENALQHLETLVKAGHLHPEVANTLRQHIFQDPMTGLGNRYAWEQRNDRNPAKATAVWDLNFLKQINDLHGHKAGDDAIKAVGNAIKEAGKKVPHSRHHRVGGDEIVSTFETPEDAHLFSRHLTEHLDKIPPLNGTHKIGVSGGIGPDFATADKSLYEAKKKKYKPEGIKLDPTGGIDSRNSELAHSPHNMPSFIHSSFGESKLNDNK